MQDEDIRDNLILQILSPLQADGNSIFRDALEQNQKEVLNLFLGLLLLLPSDLFRNSLIIESVDDLKKIIRLPNF